MGNTANDGADMAMRMRPDIIQILELVRDLLRDEYTEEDFERRRYDTLMMANALSIAARLVARGTVPEIEGLGRAQEIRNGSDVEELNVRDSGGGMLSDALPRALARAIRAGEYDPGTSCHGATRASLRDHARRAVELYNPGYLKKETT